MPEYDSSVIPDDYLEMSSGRKFWLRNPVYDPFEMAHSLSLMCRFAGHCLRFYSVAEHSILVAAIMREFGWGDPFEGLMHDGTECVLADICSPIKHGMLPDYKRVEAHFDRAMRVQFGLPLEMTKECKRADWVALAIEAYLLLPTKGAAWNTPQDAHTYAKLYMDGVGVELGRTTFDVVRRTWLDEFDLLSKKQ